MNTTEVITYGIAHYNARKSISGKGCERCGSRARVQASLKPDAPSSNLRTDDRTGCLYSVDPDDYAPLCVTCHFVLDALHRTHCGRGHAYTAANTSTRPDGSRRCLACHRTNEAIRLSDPTTREAKNEANRLYRKKNPMTPEQKARKLELQRIRRLNGGR